MEVLIVGFDCRCRLSEVGGVRAQRPQPGNRFVSFVRASGRAGAREISCYLEGLARWMFLLLSSALLLPGRCVFKMGAFSLEFFAKQ